MDLEQQYKRNEHFIYRKIEHETLLVPIKDNVGDLNCIYNLNEVGAFVWDNMDGEKTLGHIIDMITEQFDVSAQDAQADLGEFISDLEEIGAVYQ